MPQESSWFADGDACEHYVDRWSRRVGVMFWTGLHCRQD